MEEDKVMPEVVVDAPVEVVVPEMAEEAEEKEEVVDSTGSPQVAE